MKSYKIDRVRSKVTVGMAVLAALGACVGSATTADAALLVKFDVDYQSTFTSPTASGFTSLVVASTSNTGTATSNGVTATITGGPSGARDRGSATLKDPLLRDLFFTGSGSAGTTNLTISFTGLTAGTTYKFTVYSADNSVGYTTGDVSAFYQGAAATPFLNNVTVVSYIADPPPGNAGYTAMLAPLNDGTLTITAKSVSNGSGSVNSTIYTVINGFELEAVPEPGSLGLLAVGGLMMMRRRKRNL